MKIVILGPAHPYRGGIAALNERLAIQFIREGHEVTIFNFKLQYPDFLFPGKTQYTDDAAPENIPNVRKVNSVNPINWLSVGRELRRCQPDLLIVRYWLPFMAPALGTICRIVRKNRHTQLICIADNIIPHEKRIGDRLLTRYFTGKIDGFIAMSREVYKDLEKFVREPVRRYAPHPIYDHYGEIISREKALAHLNLSPEYRYLLFFGFIRNYKGLDLLLEAMADKRLQTGKVKLIVAGEYYGNEAYYQELIHILKDREVEHQERMRLIAESEQAAEETRQFNEQLRQYREQYFAECHEFFDTTLSTMHFAYETGDADGVIHAANKITEKLGGKVQYETVDEFEDFLDSDEPFVL